MYDAKTNPDPAVQNFGWPFLLGVTGLQVLVVMMLLLANAAAAFEADTGVAWATLAAAYPTVATQFAMSRQASLVGNLAVGAFALLVTFFGLRSGQRWAWFTLWILPASMLPGTVSLLRTENQAGAAVFGGVFMALAVAGLFLSYRAVFSRPVERIS